MIANRLKSIFTVLPIAVWNGLSSAHFRGVLKHFKIFNLCQQRDDTVCQVIYDLKFVKYFQSIPRQVICLIFINDIRKQS